jgi:serine/threonine-protein kinase HipA
MLAGVDGVRLSLAGAQDKIAVGLIDNKIAIMKGNTPTTHILKPMIEGIKDSVQNELFCMRLAKAMNIKVPNASIIYVDETPCYLVERFDRQVVGGKTIRVHQEDFCQAMGIPPELKYEREGGPGVERSIELLRQNSARPAADIIQFTDILIFNYLIGNADAHGKNYSLIYNSKKPQLAPAYDLLCTEIYPDLAKKMAMKLGGKYEPDMVHLRHWQKIVPDTTVAKRNLEKSLIDNASAIIPKAHEVAASLIAENSNSIVFEQIISVIEKRAKHLTGSVSGEF